MYTRRQLRILYKALVSSLYGCACARNLYESITQQKTIILFLTHTHRHPGVVYKGTNNNVIREKRKKEQQQQTGFDGSCGVFGRIQ